MADGRVTPRLIDAKEGPASRWEGWTGKPGIRMMQHHPNDDDDDEEGDGEENNGNGGESEWSQALRIMLNNSSTPPKEDDDDQKGDQENDDDNDDSHEDDHRQSNANLALDIPTSENKQCTLLDYGFKPNNGNQNSEALKQKTTSNCFKRPGKEMSHL